MDDDVDKSIKKIREILHTRKKPTMHEILVLLNKELSPITTCYIRCLTKQYKKIYSPDDEKKYFSKFMMAPLWSMVQWIQSIITHITP